MTSEEEGLDDLLDSALEDFDKLTEPQETTNKSSVGIKTTGVENEDLLKMFDCFERDLNKSVGAKDELEKLKKLSEGAEGLDVTASLEETLANMRKESEGLGKEPTEEELQAIFSNLSMSKGGMEEGLNNLLPMMEGMMQSLLSKDLLYPAIKDLADKYPDYLADHRDSLTKEQFDIYNKQCDITRKICFKFEEESESDTEKEKKARFKEIHGMMQEMQLLGNPPKELTGDPGLGATSMPEDYSLPDVPPECKVS